MRVHYICAHVCVSLQSVSHPVSQIVLVCIVVVGEIVTESVSLSVSLSVCAGVRLCVCVFVGRRESKASQSFGLSQCALVHQGPILIF